MLQLTDTGDYDTDSKQLKNLKDPTDNQDACTKAYILMITFILMEKRPMSGDLNVQNNTITNVATPSSNKDVVNKQYLEANYFKNTGGNVTRNIVVSSNNPSSRPITGISGNPLSGTAAVNLNKLNSELNKKSDVSVVTNGLSGKLDISTFNTRMARKANKTDVLLLDGTQL